jgi:hypothetical protein
LPGAQALLESFFSDAACLVGRGLDGEAEQRWLWKERRVYMFDGTTVTMPDTPENQEAYPQVYNQKPGLGFQIARLERLLPYERRDGFCLTNTRAA